MITIDAQKCVGCGQCVRDCLPGCLSLTDGKARATGSRCLLCGHCVAICPENAVRMEGCDPAEIIPAEMAITASDLQRFMKSRRSVRQFLAKPVPPDALEALIEAGRYSPTGSNSQSTGYIVLDKTLPQARQMAAETLYRLSQKPEISAYAESLRRIYADAQAGGDSLFYGAPLVLVIVDSQPTGINGALAASRMELMANALGLGACFVGFFIQALAAEPALRALLQLPAGVRPITSLAIGYPAVHYLRSAPRQKAQIIYR